MNRTIFVIGTSGLARELALVITQINMLNEQWVFGGFVAEHESDVGMDLGLGVVVGTDAWLLGREGATAIAIGIGIPRVRARVVAMYRSDPRFQFPNLIHPNAMLDQKWVRMGRGNVVTAGCVFTCQIEVADFNYFNLNATVGHDVKIGSYNVVNPSANISGNVLMGDRILVGTGSQILETITIADDVTIGAGAVLRTNALPGTTMVGVPAKPLAR